MKKLLLLFLLPAFHASAQETPARDSVHIIVASPAVGPVIDSAEKAQYGVFPFWRKEEFAAAQFILQADSSVVLRGTMKDGAVKTLPLTRRNFLEMAYVINYRAGRIRTAQLSWIDLLGAVVVGALNVAKECD